MQVSTEHFLFSIHVIVHIEVNCLCASGCIKQILLHALVVELLTLLLCQVVFSTHAAINATCTTKLLESLACANDARTFTSCGLLTRCLAHHSFAFSLLLVTLRIGHSLVNQVGNENGTKSKKTDDSCLFIIFERRWDSLHLLNYFDFYVFYCVVCSDWI